MNLLEGPLTLVLTRRCDLRCAYCPQSFADRDMSVEVLEAAVRHLAGASRPDDGVKLFGGEPLLVPDLVRRAVELVTQAAPVRPIDIPTNGLHLSGAMALFLRERPNIQVSLSRPSRAAQGLPNVLVNFLLTPGECAAEALRRLAAWVADGARRFNILPAYYVSWSETELGELRRTLAGAARLMTELAAAGRGVELANASRWGPAPLYNGGLCVDTDGAVYATNLFLAEAVEPRREAFRLGDVFNPSALLAPPPAQALLDEARRCFPPEVMRSTLAVDALLTEFLHGR